MNPRPPPPKKTFNIILQILNKIQKYHLHKNCLIYLYSKIVIHLLNIHRFCPSASRSSYSFLLYCISLEVGRSSLACVINPAACQVVPPVNLKQTRDIALWIFHLILNQPSSLSFLSPFFLSLFLYLPSSHSQIFDQFSCISLIWLTSCKQEAFFINKSIPNFICCPKYGLILCFFLFFSRSIDIDLGGTKKLTVPVPATLHLSSQPWPGDRPQRFQPHPLHWWPPWHSGAGMGGSLLMTESNTAYSLPTTLHCTFLVFHVKTVHFEAEKLSCSKPHFLNTATPTLLLSLSVMDFFSCLLRLRHQLQQHIKIDHICLHHPIFF